MFGIICCSLIIYILLSLINIISIQVLIDYGLSLNSDESGAEPLAQDHDMLRFSETAKALSFITIDANTKHLLQHDTNQSKNNKKTDMGKKSKKSGNKENENGLDTTAPNNKDNDTQGRLQFYNEPFKLLVTHQLFERLNDIIIGQFGNFGTIYWLPMVENAMQCIFKMADNPIMIVESMVIQIWLLLLIFSLKNSISYPFFSSKFCW